MELFTNYFHKLKTTFGHKILDEEQAEDFDESEAFCINNFFFFFYEINGKIRARSSI